MQAISRNAYVVLTLMASGVLMTAPEGADSDPFSELQSEVRRQQQGAATEKSDFERYKEAQKADFDAYKEQVRKEFKAFKAIQEEAESDYHDKLARVWDSPETSSKKRWVEYQEDYRRRISIDFEQQRISLSWPEGRIDPLTDGAAVGILKDLVTLTRKQAFEQDEVAQDIENASRERLGTLETADVESVPVLMNYLLGQTEVDDEAVAQQVEHFMDNREMTRKREGEQVIRTWVSLSVSRML